MVKSAWWRRFSAVLVPIITGYGIRKGLVVADPSLTVHRETGRPTILVKIGGSSITNKANKETLNQTAFNWFVDTLAAHRPDRDAMHGLGGLYGRFDYVVVHGAGSFGHHTAKEFGLKGASTPPAAEEPSGIVNEQSRQGHFNLTMGMSKTRLSVQTLNRLLVQAMIERNLPAVGVSPCFGSPIVQSHGGGLRDVVDSVVNMLRIGLVPVLHGDVCPYGTHGGGILSGDTIMTALGKSISFYRVVFITDVDGVYNSDPRKDSTAELVSTVHVGPDGTVLTEVNASESSHEHDVTGGFETKLRCASEIVQHNNTTVYVVRHGTVSAKQALGGEPNVDVATMVQRSN